MTTKKTILFTIDSLATGGAEKSLITLLSHIDYNKYSVDLQLFSYGGTFEQFLPKEVKLLPPTSYSIFLKNNIAAQLLQPKKIIARFLYSFRIRRNKLLHADKARIYWQTIGEFIEKSEKRYDVAIAYAQCIPTYYIVDKIIATKRFAWVNAILNLSGVNKEYNKYYYSKLDSIVLVSDSVFNFFSTVIYPDLLYKMRIIWDLIDADTIKRLATLPISRTLDHSFPIIMTTGRLNKPQKGYDIALETARILRDRGIKYRWYAIGNGPYRAEMEQYIKVNHLEDYFILLGSISNPYNYMNQCDIYVQTSRFEGFGLTIAEAKILNRPVVCTNFVTCSIHIKDGENGLIASFEPIDIANKIEILLKDRELYSRIHNNLKKEVINNLGTINQFYKLIESE